MDRRNRSTNNGCDKDLLETMNNCTLRDDKLKAPSASASASTLERDDSCGAHEAVGLSNVVEKSVAIMSRPMAVAPPREALFTETLAMDCEGVGIGPKGTKNVAARVSIVNEHGECVYDTFIKISQPVTDYRTWLTGIEQKHLDTGRDLKEVRHEVQTMLKGRKLVGHALHNDFRMLQYEHPEYLVRDTSTYDPFRSLSGKCHPSLKALAKLILNITIQDGIHDSIIDARTAMQLYQKHKKVWEESEYGWPILPEKQTLKDEEIQASNARWL